MRTLRVMLAMGLMSFALTSYGQAAGTTGRVEVPIQQVRLSDGAIRYWVPVTVGGAPVQAMMDTGSFGLRILASALPSGSYQPTDLVRHYPFGSGARLHGVIATAVVGIGGATTGAAIPIQVVQSVDCVEAKPHCPVSRVSPEDYLIGGDGLPREGFPAILGLSMRSGQVRMGANNPLSILGDRAWIVILPRPGDQAPGRLIINPDRTDLAGFKTYQMRRQVARGLASGGQDAPGWRDLSVPTCSGGGRTKQHACLPTRLDSGDPAGVGPYLSHAVLYDQNRGVIGTKAR